MSCQNRNFRVFSEEKSYIAGLSSPCSFLLTRLTFSEGAELVAYGAKGLVLWQQSIICNSAFHVHHHLLLLKKKKKNKTWLSDNSPNKQRQTIIPQTAPVRANVNNVSFLFFYFNWFFFIFHVPPPEICRALWKAPPSSHLWFSWWQARWLEVYSRWAAGWLGPECACTNKNTDTFSEGVNLASQKKQPWNPWCLRKSPCKQKMYSNGVLGTKAQVIKYKYNLELYSIMIMFLNLIFWSHIT